MKLTVRDVLDRAGVVYEKGGRLVKFTCPDPQHPDNDPSANIYRSKNNNERVKCQSCSGNWGPLDLVNLYGIVIDSKPEEVAVYSYTDEDGRVLFEQVRYEPKDFRIRVPRADGTYAYRLNGTRRVPYRLPDVLQAIRKEQPILVTEGEKDAEAVRKMGLVATTNPFGAGKWTDEISEYLRGAAAVAVIADADKKGREHAQAVAESVSRFAPVKVVELPGAKDAYEWVSRGGTIQELDRLLKQTPRFTPVGSTPAPVDKPATSSGLKLIKASAVKVRPIEWLDKGKVALRALTLLAGEGGKGKSTIMTDKVARATRGQLHGSYRDKPVNVIWAGNEDGYDDVIVPRLIVAGADLDRVRFVALESESLAEEMNIVTNIDGLKEACTEHDIKLIVMDPLVEYLPGSTDSHNDMSIRQALRPVRNLAAELNLSAVGLIHFNKAPTLAVASRLAGSAAFRNAARSVLVVADHPDDNQENRRVMFQNKSNWGPEERLGWAYTLESVEVPDGDGVMLDGEGEPFTTARAVWKGTIELDPGNLPSTHTEREAPQRDAAKQMLRDLLCGGPRLRDDIKDKAILEEIGWITVRRAAEEIGIETHQPAIPGKRGKGPSWWGLPGTDWDRLLTTPTNKDEQPNPDAESAGQTPDSVADANRLLTTSGTGSAVSNHSGSVDNTYPCPRCNRERVFRQGDLCGLCLQGVAP